MTISHGSLAELLDSLDEALAKRYIEMAEFEDLDRAVKAAKSSANGLRRYLQNTPTPKERLKFGPRSRNCPKPPAP